MTVQGAMDRARVLWFASGVRPSGGIMKILLRSAAALAMSALLWSGPAPVVAQGAPALVLRGGTLIDGLGGAPVANAVVVIQGNRIAAAGAANRVTIPAGARLIDTTGKYLIPGLIDGKSN